MMYIMKNMNREKKAATEAERDALLLEGYIDVTPANKQEPTTETDKNTETDAGEQELPDSDVKEEEKVSKKKV